MLKLKSRNFHCRSLPALAKSLAVCCVVLLSLQQSAAQGRLNVWRSSGPSFDILTVVVDPFDPNIIYAGSQNGVFKSTDNGASWRVLNLGAASDLSVDYINPNTIYAANEGVYKSTDGGLRWINLNSPPASKVQVSPNDPNFIVAADYNNNIFVTNNGGASWETRPFPDAIDILDAFEIDPQNPNNIYTGYVWGDFIYLRRSNDGGASWTEFNYGEGLSSATTAFNADSNNPNIIYASAFTGFYKSTNGGENWTQRGAIPISRAVAISPQSLGIIYAAAFSSSGMRRSLDDGASWSTFNTGLSNQSINDLEFSRAGRFLHAATAAGVFSVRVRTTENADFDGDGRSDISVFRPSDRVWYLNQSTAGFSATQFGLSTDRITPADFDGDGTTDISVYRDGVWYRLNSSNQSVEIVQFGIASDIPVPADYTGDGQSELAVYRDGTWWTLDLTNNQIRVVNFGLATDKPVAADYDGDGWVDQAIYRNGEWHINRSTQGYTVLSFGLTSDQPVPADYDGDGKTDVAVYRNGEWHINRSLLGYTLVNFGLSTDVPTPADYDGDGKTDMAVYRAGTWYVLKTTAGSRSNNSD